MEERKYGGMTLEQLEQFQSDPITAVCAHIRELQEELARERADKAIKLENAYTRADVMRAAEKVRAESHSAAVFSEARTMIAAIDVAAIVDQCLGEPAPAVSVSHDDARHAAQYRWMLENCTQEDENGWAVLHFETARQLKSHSQTAEWMDADIEAAMLAAAPKHGEGEA